MDTTHSFLGNMYLLFKIVTWRALITSLPAMHKLQLDMSKCIGRTFDVCPLALLSRLKIDTSNYTTYLNIYNHHIIIVTNTSFTLGGCNKHHRKFIQRINFTVYKNHYKILKITIFTKVAFKQKSRQIF